MGRKNRQLQEDTTYMNSMVDEIVAERKAGGDRSEKKDLLDYMLTGVDKETGEQLDDVNIRYQIITFLIAGHETTSGLLSFTLYYLLNNPEVLAKAYEEVDRVLGGDLSTAPTYEQVKQLRYVSQILKESLRLWPTAPAFTRHSYEPAVLGGKYQIDKQDQLMVLTPILHRDPKIWGENAEAFDPGQVHPRGRAEQAGQRLQAVRHRAAGLHRSPVRHAGGDARAGDDPAALRAHRPHQLRAEGQADPHHQAGRLPHQGPAAHDRPAAVAAPRRHRSRGPGRGTETEPALVVQGSTPLLVLFGSNLGRPKA